MYVCVCLCVCVAVCVCVCVILGGLGGENAKTGKVHGRTGLQAQPPARGFAQLESRHGHAGARS
jgi:hypothetical protein